MLLREEHLADKAGTGPVRRGGGPDSSVWVIHAIKIGVGRNHPDVFDGYADVPDDTGLRHWIDLVDLVRLFLADENLAGPRPVRRVVWNNSNAFPVAAVGEIDDLLSDP